MYRSGSAVEHLAHVQPRERDLRRAGEIELVALDRVDVRAVGREEPGAVHRLLADEHRRQHRQMSVPDRRVEREAVDREREQRRVAEHVAEARAGEPRGPLHVEAADLGVLLHLGELRRLAPAPDLDRIVLRVAVGRGVVRRVRDSVSSRSRSASAEASSCSAVLQLLLHAPQLLELLRRRLALLLRAPAQVVDARDEGPPALVGGEPGVEGFGSALARELPPELVRVVARCAGVDHERESRYASSRAATPSSSTEGTTSFARRRISSWAFATATGKPAQSRSSRSFSPSPHADRLRGDEPEPVGDELESRALAHVRMRELEEVRQRLRDEQPSRIPWLQLRLELVERMLVAHGDELRRRLRQPVAQRADRVDLEVLEVRVASRFRCDLGDVQEVVDVAVEMEAGGDDGVDHLERVRQRDRHVPQELSGDRVGDDRALVADHGVVDSGLEDVRPHRAEHPPGDDDHAHSGGARGADRRPRARAQDGVLGDEGAVQVDRERGERAGEVRGELERGGYGALPPVEVTT